MKKPLILAFFALAGSALAQSFDLPVAPKATPAPPPEAPVPVSIPAATATPAPAAPPAGVSYPTPAKVTASATPKPKKVKVHPNEQPSLGFYSGTIRIVNVDNVGCVGVDQKTGATIVCTPRFKGHWPCLCIPNILVTFKGNKILAIRDGATIIAPMPGEEDRTPYTGPATAPGATQTAVGVAGSAIGVAGTVLGILGSIHK